MLPFGNSAGFSFNVRQTVKQDVEGFENIDDFWLCEEIVKKKVNQNVTSDTEEFNYDTSDTISVSSEEDIMAEAHSPSFAGGDDDTTISYTPLSNSLNRSNKSISSSRRVSFGSSHVSSMPATPLMDNSYSSIQPSTSTGGASVGSSSSKGSLDMSVIQNDEDEELEMHFDEADAEFSHSPMSSRRHSTSSSRSLSDDDKLDMTNSDDMNTPGSKRGNISMVSTPGTSEFPRGHKEADDTFAPDYNSNSDGELADTDEEWGNNTTAMTDMSSASWRAEQRAAMEEMPEEDDEDGRRRSSRRVTKGQRFQFWKNERPVYNKGDIVGLLSAKATPIKKRSVYEKEAVTSGASKKAKTLSKKMDVEEPLKYPKNVEFIPTDEADELIVYDEMEELGKSRQKVVCFRDSVVPSQLPIAGKRQKGRRGIASAAQSFNQQEQTGANGVLMSQWISGFLELPPGAIKDDETVGQCSQVYFVSECQDKGVEMAIAHPDDEVWNPDRAQRVLLKKGDSFHIPAGNIYRVENHSQTTPCVIFWTIIKAIVNPVQMVNVEEGVVGEVQ